MTTAFRSALILVIGVVLAIFGFALGGVELYFHLKANGESLYRITPFVISGLLILFGGLLVDTTHTSRALTAFESLFPFITPLIAAIVPGGRRSTDPVIPTPPGFTPPSDRDKP